MLEKNKTLNLNETDYLFKELHSICSYLAMFPPHVPEEYIKKLTKEGDIVYDPFSGRGTTSLEAIKLKRKSYSNDLSPLAYVLTKSKTFTVSKEKSLKRVDELMEEYNTSFNKNINFSTKKFDNIRVFFSKNNLRQLLFIREKLGENFEDLDNVDNYILAISLGILHGQTRKSGESIYFSVSMPNGYSMSPNYAKKYIKEKNLKLIKTNIFEQIKCRISKKPNNFMGNTDMNKVFLKDALKSSEFIKEKPDLIFTSPPYLNIVKYISQNWIRFWILGFDKNQTKERIVDDFHNVESYKIFLLNFLKEMEKIMKKETKLVLVIGDVKTFMIKPIIKELLPNTKLKLIGEPKSHILRRKLSQQMGNRVGYATPQDWIFKMELK